MLYICHYNYYSQFSFYTGQIKLSYAYKYEVNAAPMIILIMITLLLCPKFKDKLYTNNDVLINVSNLHFCTFIYKHLNSIFNAPDIF